MFGLGRAAKKPEPEKKKRSHDLTQVSCEVAMIKVRSIRQQNVCVCVTHMRSTWKQEIAVR